MRCSERCGDVCRLRDGIRSGRRTTPDFQHAARLTRMIADLARGARHAKRGITLGWRPVWTEIWNHAGELLFATEAPFPSWQVGNPSNKLNNGSTCDTSPERSA